MKKVLIYIIMAVVTMPIGGALYPQASFQSKPRIVPGQVVIKYKRGILAKTTASSLEALGITVTKSFEELPFVVGKFSPEKNIEEVLDACRALPNVEYAEPNYYVYAIEGKQEAIADRHEVMTAPNGAVVIPNDPRFSEQWNLNQANDYDIDAPEAWNITTGSPDIIVGVIDTGIDYDHEDLQANIWHNAGESGGGKENNGIDDDGNGYKDDFRGWNFVFNSNDPYDDNDHGTFNAGVIGAVGNNGNGIAGINWRVKLMALKFLDANGSGTTEGAAEAIIYAVRNGAKVLNNSWGGGGFSRLLEDVIKFANDQGVLFIAAAGAESSNNDVTPNYPAGYEVLNVVAVTSSDRNDMLSSFSNYGRRTVDVAAPGSVILSTQPLNRYRILSRTATSQATGACALVWAQYPALKPRQVLIRVLGSVDRIAEMINRLTTGGRLNAANAFSTSPIIAYTTDLASLANITGPYPIMASVVDDGAVTQVRLVYQINGATNDTLNMAPGENDTYSTALPIQPPNTVINYWVVATDNDGKRTTGPIFTAETFPLSAPNFILPSFPTLTNDPTPTFQWTTIRAAAGYEVSFLDSLKTLEIFNYWAEKDTINSAVYTYKLSNKLPDGIWHIRIRSVDSSKQVSSWSPADSGKRFTVDTTPPTEPILEKAELTSANIRTLRWRASIDLTSGLDRYLVNIDKPDSGLSIQVTLPANLTQYTTIPLSDGVWNWQVTAFDRVGNLSSSSDKFIINVGRPPAAPTIRLETPITKDNTPTISWFNVDGAVSFRLQYATTPTFSNLVDINGLIEKSYTFAKPLEDGEYYFRVFARSEGGAESVASPTEKLTIDTRPPQASILAISRGAPFTNAAAVVVNLSANEADSIRLLGDLSSDNLKRFRLFNLENRIGVRDTVTLTADDGPKSLQAQFKDLAGNITNAFGSIFLDTHGPIFSSNPPQLSVEKPAISQEVAVSLTRPADGNGSGVKTFKLHYRRGGEAWREISFNTNNQARLPSEFVTNRGVDYQIVADDSAGNISRVKNGSLNFFSIPVLVPAGEAGRSEVFPGGAETAFFRLISLPLLMANKTIGEAFSELGVYGAKNDYRLWRYTGGRAFSEGAQAAVRPGESYFLIKRKSGSLSNQLPGETAKTSDAALGNIPGWQLRANDWTFIGNPFTFEIPLADLKLKKGDTTLAALANIWKYSGAGENKGWTQNFSRMIPWEGFIIFNDDSTDTLVYTPLPFAALAKPTVVDSSGWLNKSTSYREKLGEGDWVVQVRAESQDAQDNENYFGVREGAKIKKDRFDLYEPPFLPGGISLSFVQQDTASARYWTADIQPPNQAGCVWTLQLKGVGGNKVRLQFDGLASLPAELEICLLDQTAGLLRHLRFQPALEIYLPHSTGIKQLNLLVGDKKFVEEKSAGLYSIPQTFALRQNYPNPFNPATVIRYELPVPGAVTLRIYNLLGAEILTVEKEVPCEAGYYEKVIDLRAFASGIYFYRLSMRGERSFAQTKKMVLAK